MEKVQDQPQTLEVFENDIALYLSEFCDEQGIEDIKKESQSVWNGALMYIRRHVFPVSDCLKSRNNIQVDNNTIPSNFNAYNYELVNSVCDYYIYLCMMYDKEVSIIGFSNLTGIDTDTINEWGNNSIKLSTTSAVVYKKLQNFREESLSNKLVTGRQNPVGVLGVLNRHFSWNMPGVRSDTDKRHAMTAQELPKLDGKGAIMGIESQTVVQNAQEKNDG